MESRFSQVCKELGLQAPPSIAAASENRQQIQNELLAEYSTEIGLQHTPLQQDAPETNEFAYGKERKQKMTEERLMKLTITRLKEELRARNIVPPSKASKVTIDFELYLNIFRKLTKNCSEQLFARKQAESKLQ